MGIELGQVVDGKYRVTARIGEGGMGAVYAGEHLKLHRKVAIKVLHAAVAGDPEVVTRFEREAQAAGRIGNDHILEVFDIGEFPGGDHYMVMEFLEGEPMNARLQRLGRLAPRQIYPLARQMLEGLVAAHAAGIVHRDLKPANIFILREKAGLPDYVKLIDFGISKFRSIAGDADHQQTRTGTIIGTPSYMSPEQARGLREADARSDIYAVGVILYEAVTGRCPFEGASTNDLLFKIFLNEAPPIETLVGDVDPAFCTLIMKALSKDPDDRFASAATFIAALDAWMQTGASVAVARGAEPEATYIERPPLASVPDGRERVSAPQTQGSWAGSRHGIPGLRTSRSTKVTLIAVALVAAIAGVGLAMLSPRGPSHATSPAAAAPASAPPPPSTAEKLAEPAAEPTPVPAVATPAPSATSAAPSAPQPPPARTASPRAASTSQPPRSSPHAPKPAPTPQPPTNPFEDR